MIVYVETNFLLEIILGQEELKFAQEIVRLAQQAKVRLRFPPFSLMEPMWTIRGRGRERYSMNDQLKKELSQLKRSVYHTQVVQLIQDLSPKIMRIEYAELERLEATFLSLLQTGSPIDLTYQIYQMSIYSQKEFNLPPQDAIVFSSIISDLKLQNPSHPKLFLSKNTKDFNQDSIKEELRAHNCRYFGKFKHALGYINSHI